LRATQSVAHYFNDEDSLPNNKVCVFRL